MEMKAGLTFACMNLKKLAKMKQRMGVLEEGITQLFLKIWNYIYKQRKVALEC